MMRHLHFKRVFFIVLFCLSLLVSNARGQQVETTPTPQPSTEAQQQVEDVVRVSTDLVQTDVMVFDKGGNFVDKLSREQFVLRVDGKPQPISFFERVAAGSVNEEAQLAAARGATSRASSNNKNSSSATPLDRGRLIYFFIDDLHLSPGSVPRTRATLLHFIEKEMGQNDQAAIITATGQIGFLQQLTDNKTVLRAAVQRLLPRANLIADMDRPPMSEFQALSVARYSQDVTDYFVDRILEDNPTLGRDTAVEMVRNRANNMLRQSANYTTATLSTLNNVLRATAPLPGRKLLFFLSDGFFLDDQTSSVSSELRRLTDVAARSGAVIYTMDARGLSTGQTDASTEGNFDPTGRLARSSMGELSESQEALNALAADTGGRALRNSNDLAAGVKNALKETSVYYLLAWRPEEGEHKSGKFRRIEVSVTGRPDLTVRVRRGFIEPDNNSPNAATNKRSSKEKRPAPVKSADDELRAALATHVPRSNLPTAVSVNYLDAPVGGALIHTTIQIQPEAVGFTTANGKRTAEIDLAGVVFDDRGKPANSFRDHLNISLSGTKTEEFPHTPIFYNYQAQLAPGLYQVRVASRDVKSGLTGSATQWIEIPNLAAQHLAMSSLFIGERIAEPTGTTTPDSDAMKQVQMSVDRHFARSSRLRFVTYIYNAARNPATNAPPDVAIQIQIFRDDQPVITTPLRKIETEGKPDLARLPYAAEISLGSLPAGHYALRVSAIDRVVKASATQQTSFEID